MEGLLGEQLGVGGGHPTRRLAQALIAEVRAECDEQAYGRALRGADSRPLATAAEGAAVMCVLDAARRSDAVGGDTIAVEGVTVASVTSARQSPR